MSDFTLIEDYKLDILFANPEGHVAADGKNDVFWQQLVQYAVCHAVNDYYTLPAEQRTEPQLIERLIEERWTNRHYKFHSSMHFLQAKACAISCLTDVLVHKAKDATPMILFEQITTELPDIASQLSVIVQVLACEGEGPHAPLVIQKFMAEDNEHMINAFVQIASVLCSTAFGRLPERIEVVSIMQGKVFTFHPTVRDEEEAMDYLRLIREVVIDAQTATDSCTGSACSCSKNERQADIRKGQLLM